MLTPNATIAGNGASTTGIIHRLVSEDQDVKLKALRQLKNQIIGNRTKKLMFLKLGAVPAVATILADAISADDVINNNYNDNKNNDYNYSVNKNIIVQSAAVLGSFACGFDPGVQAVLEAGAFQNLSRLLSNLDEKVVGAGARSLKMIYQSKCAPKYDFLEEKNMEFLLSLLNNENETVNGLGASIITHSCKTSLEQKILFDAGVLKKLTSLLQGSLSQRDASLESLATIFNNNSEVVLKFVGPDSGKALVSIIELVKDRSVRTRLLASLCLIVISNASPCYLQDVGIKAKLITTLLELLDDPGQIGEEASFGFSRLIAQKEDVHKLAFEHNAVDKLYDHLQKGSLHPRKYEGILLALADMCSKLECCRDRFLSLQHSDSVNSYIESSRQGFFMNEMVVIPLVRLLNEPSTSVQVAALGAVSNIVVDLTTCRSTFFRFGGVKQLVQLSKSMDATIRLNALWALRNLMFLAENKCKEEVFTELTAPLLASLICDPESFVQEQALSFARNLIDGCIDSVEYMFAEDGIIFDAVGRQLKSVSKAEIAIQGMYVLSNVSTGKEYHKEAVINQLLSHEENGTQSCAFSRFVRLSDAGIVSQMKNMVNDPCLDVKLRVRTALVQFTNFEDGSR